MKNYKKEREKEEKNCGMHTQPNQNSYNNNNKKKMQRKTGEKSARKIVLAIFGPNSAQKKKKDLFTRCVILCATIGLYSYEYVHVDLVHDYENIYMRYVVCLWIRCIMCSCRLIFAAPHFFS